MFPPSLLLILQCCLANSAAVSNVVSLDVLVLFRCDIQINFTGHCTPDGDYNATIMAAEMELRNRGIIDTQVQFRYHLRESKYKFCSNYGTISETVVLRKRDNIAVIFGPPCSTELYETGRLAARWNVPLFAYTFSNTKLENRQLYPTMVLTSIMASQSQIEALRAVVHYFGWKQVGIIGWRAWSSYLARDVKTSFNSIGVNVNIQIALQERKAKEILQLGLLDDVKKHCRVLIVYDVYWSDLVKVLTALDKFDVSAPEFVILALATVPSSTLPWLREGSNKVDKRIRRLFVNVIMVFLPLYLLCQHTYLCT